MKNRILHDTDIIQIRNKVNQQIKDQERLDELQVNDINNGYIRIEGERMICEYKNIEDKISVIMPNTFQLMEQSYIDLKYAAYKKKDKLIYTNDETTVNLIFDFRETKMQDDETEEVRNQFSNIILKTNPSSKIIEKGTIGTADFLISYFDLISPAIDSEIYNLMFLFSYLGTLCMGTFNCLESEMHNWEDIARQMIKSIKFFN